MPPKKRTYRYWVYDGTSFARGDPAITAQDVVAAESKLQTILTDVLTAGDKAAGKPVGLSLSGAKQKATVHIYQYKDGELTKELAPSKKNVDFKQIPSVLAAMYHPAEEKALVKEAASVAKTDLKNSIASLESDQSKSNVVRVAREASAAIDAVVAKVDSVANGPNDAAASTVTLNEKKENLAAIESDAILYNDDDSDTEVMEQLTDNLAKTIQSADQTVSEIEQAVNTGSIPFEVYKFVNRWIGSDDIVYAPDSETAVQTVFAGDTAGTAYAAVYRDDRLGYIVVSIWDVSKDKESLEPLVMKVNYDPEDWDGIQTVRATAYAARYGDDEGVDDAEEDDADIVVLQPGQPGYRENLRQRILKAEQVKTQERIEAALAKRRAEAVEEDADDAVDEDADEDVAEAVVDEAADVEAAVDFDKAVDEAIDDSEAVDESLIWTFHYNKEFDKWIRVFDRSKTTNPYQPDHLGLTVDDLDNVNRTLTKVVPHLPQGERVNPILAFAQLLSAPRTYWIRFWWVNTSNNTAKQDEVDEFEATDNRIIINGMDIENAFSQLDTVDVPVAAVSAEVVLPVKEDADRVIYKRFYQTNSGWQTFADTETDEDETERLRRFWDELSVFDEEENAYTFVDPDTVDRLAIISPTDDELPFNVKIYDVLNEGKTGNFSKSEDINTGAGVVFRPLREMEHTTTNGIFSLKNMKLAWIYWVKHHGAKPVSTQKKKPIGTKPYRDAPSAEAVALKVDKVIAPKPKKGTSVLAKLAKRVVIEAEEEEEEEDAEEEDVEEEDVEEDEEDEEEEETKKSTKKSAKKPAKKPTKSKSAKDAARQKWIEQRRKFLSRFGGDDVPTKVIKPKTSGGKSSTTKKSGGVKHYEMDSKFWEISINDRTVTRRWGKQGTNGQTKVEKFATAEKARASVAKLVKEKTGKGYTLT